MKKIYLIDANSFIYRMFFGLPEFSTKDGRVVNAIFGMGKFFVHQLVREKPDYIFFIKDAKGKNFRHDLYDDYKATRDRMPDNLRSQIDDIEKMVELMGVHLLQIEGYEADDVIGTLAKELGKEKYNDIYILSGDKDLYSLVTENVKIYDTMKKQVFNREKTIEKFGVPPERVIDYLSIVGDKSDNIPGIDGFGPKKAVDLINFIGGVEEIYQAVEQVIAGEKSDKDFEKSVQSCFKGKTFEKLQQSKEDAFLSKKLATLDTSVHLDCAPFIDYLVEGNFLESFAFNKKSLLNERVKDFFRNLEFHSLIGEEEEDFQEWKDLNLNVKIIGDKQGLDELMNLINNLPLSKGVPDEGGGGIRKIVLDTETTALDTMEAELTGVSIYLDDENIYYMNRLHEGPRVQDEDLKAFLEYLFSLDILIIGHNIKYDLEILDRYIGGDLKSKNKVRNEQGSVGQISLDI